MSAKLEPRVKTVSVRLFRRRQSPPRERSPVEEYDAARTQARQRPASSSRRSARTAVTRPPDSSAHDPADGLRTPPIRPNATAVPTPVARMPVGKTCAASAYIVVWTALMSPPVHASITSTAKADCIPMGTAAIAAAPATAPAVMASIVSREPRRTMMMAPRMAPTTPPRLNAASPLLATPTSNPASGEQRRHPVGPDVHREQAEEERPAQRQRVASELGQEELARGHTPNGLLRCRPRTRRPGRTSWPSRRRSAASSDHRSRRRARYAWRFRKDLQQDGCQDQGKDAADQKERAPPEAGQDLRADDARKRAAERDAHDGERDGERSVPPRDVFGGKRRGVGHRTAKAEARRRTAARRA